MSKLVWDIQIKADEDMWHTDIKARALVSKLKDITEIMGPGIEFNIIKLNRVQNKKRKRKK